MNAIVSIDRAGRVVLPKVLRDQFNLHPGSQLAIAISSDHLELTPLEASPSLARDGEVWVHQGVAESPLGDAIQQIREERVGNLVCGGRR